MGTNGDKWGQMGTNGDKWGQMGTNEDKWGQMGTNGTKKDKLPCLSRFVPICPQGQNRTNGTNGDEDCCTCARILVTRTHLSFKMKCILYIDILVNVCTTYLHNRFISRVCLQ
jgi:hypothetical protein